MKTPITIRATPMFYISASKPIVDMLVQLSALHYDATCVGAGKTGGHLWGWRNCVSDPEPIPVRATTRELDLTLKILEMAPALEIGIQDRFALNDFRSDIRRAIQAADEYLSDKVVEL